MSLLGLGGKCGGTKFFPIQVLYSFIEMFSNRTTPQDRTDRFVLLYAHILSGWALSLSSDQTVPIILRLSI